MEPMCPFTLRTASGEVIPTDTDAPVTIALARATITVSVDVVELPSSPCRPSLYRFLRGVQCTGRPDVQGIADADELLNGHRPLPAQEDGQAVVGDAGALLQPRPAHAGLLQGVDDEGGEGFAARACGEWLASHGHDYVPNGYMM